MASTIWKGVIRLGEEAVPVKLRSAVTDRTIRFRLLDEPRGAPVEQRMVNPETGKAVPFEKIRRGVETESGEIVVLEGAGHLSNLEAQGPFLEALRGLLDRVG